MFLWLIIQLLTTTKPAHKILSLTHRNCPGKPNIWIHPPLLQKNKYGPSQLYRDQIFSHTIYLWNRKFDWCLIVDPIWLVWHTYLSHWSTHWTAHNIPDAPTKMLTNLSGFIFNNFNSAVTYYFARFGGFVSLFRVLVQYAHTQPDPV